MSRLDHTSSSFPVKTAENQPLASFSHRAVDAEPRRFSRRQFFSGAAALGVLGALTACSTGPSLSFNLNAPPTRGGILRVGLTGGSSADTLDPHIPVNSGDIARTVNLFEPLLSRDDDYQLQYRLAESMEPNSDATHWTIRLREGLQFSDGTELTAEDVVFTVERIRNPEDPKNGAASLVAVDEVRAEDARTVVLTLNTPDAELDDAFSQYQMGIVPRGFDPLEPVGAGPFRLSSFSAGQSTVLERNPFYMEGDAHLDEIHLLNFNDQDAMLNALLSTQVDCIGQIPPTLARVVQSDERLDILDSQTGTWLPFTMRVDQEPFDDVRVRQAFRLAIDRQQMIDQVFSGYGQVGNDMFALYDEHYPDQLPQRTQDIAEARRLLAEAGYPDGITVELVTAPIQAGAIEAAQVFAQQAQEAGITINLRRVDTTTFFGEQYLQWNFAQSFWYTRNFIAQANQCAVAESPFNETHWNNETFNATLAEAKAEVDEDRRGELIATMQQQLYEEGGYIVWGYSNQVDAYQKYVAGLRPNATGLPLSAYNFHRVWLAEVNA